MARWPGFIGPSYTAQSKLAAYDRTVNLIPAKIESGTGEAEYVFNPSPGFSLFATMPTSPGRGMLSFNGGTFGIAGTALYLLPTTVGGSPTLRAQGLSDVNDAVAQMVTNGDAGHQLLIRSDSTIYVLDLLAPISETTTLDPPATAPSKSSDGTSLLPPTSAPSVNTMNVSQPVGHVAGGTYQYAITFRNDVGGETTPGPALTLFLDPATQYYDVFLRIPAGGIGLRNVYRTTSGGSQLKFLTQYNGGDGPTTGPEDSSPDSALGANAPTVNTTITGDMAVGYYGYAFTFVTATGETLVSPVGVIQATLGQVVVAGLLTGPETGPSTVTARVVYRTTVQATAAEAQSAQLKLRLTLSDNATGYFLDTMDDTVLGANAPTTNTATTTLYALMTLPFTSSQIAFIDGYGLSLDANTSTLRWSAPEDFTSWDDLDALQRNDLPDKWVAMIVAHKEIWLFGSVSTSVYYNSDGDPPFVPNPSVSITRGIVAPISLQLLNGSPVWLADDLTVRYANGYTPQRISTHAVEFALRQYTTVTDAEGEVYNEQGHQFYVLNFPTANASWCYDLTSGMWSERGPWNGLDFDVLDARTFTDALGRNLVLSRSTGAIYEMSQAFAVEMDGTGIERLRRAPHLTKENQGVIIDSVEVRLDVGVALATGIGSDPQLSLRQSRDGGQTWSNWRTISTGRIGQFTTRAVWRQLGWGRDRLIEVRASNPVPYQNWLDAYMDVRVGAS